MAPLKVRTEILPSEEAQARMAPSSWGAHDTELTEVEARAQCFLSVECRCVSRYEVGEGRTRRGMQ
jgi:hypothetical protein